MAIDNETKRASVLNVGSFFPGRIPYLTEPSGSDLDSEAERGTVLQHYAGIDAAAPGGAANVFEIFSSPVIEVA